MTLTDEDRDRTDRDETPEPESSEQVVTETSAEEAGETGETEKAGETEKTGEPGEPGPAARSRRAGWLRVGAVTAVFVVLLGLCGFLGWQVWQQRQLDRAADEARQAAVEYARILTSIDADKVDENFAQVLDGATGEFRDMYSASSAQLRQLLIDNKASARGVVLESAVQSAGEDEVVVLLFIDQTVSNAHVPEPRIDRSRVKMTMRHVDGTWRAAKVALP